MATYTIHCETTDPHHPMQGYHTPLHSGEAVLCGYGPATVEYGGEEMPLQAHDIDAMNIGDSFTFWDRDCDLITIARVA